MLKHFCDLALFMTRFKLLLYYKLKRETMYPFVLKHLIEKVSFQRMTSISTNTLIIIIIIIINTLMTVSYT